MISAAYIYALYATLWKLASIASSIYMKQLKTCIYLILALSLTFSSFCQTRKAEEYYVKYLKQLKSFKNDTILIVKSGCTGCEVTYTDTLRSVEDGQTIYVLTQKWGVFKLAIFDDMHSPKYFKSDTCSVFDTIEKNKSLLELKDSFYKTELDELKKSKFTPPRPIHYSYEEVIILLPDFEYNFIVNGKDADYLGFIRENENWFKATKTIIEKFISYSKSIKG